MRIHRRWSWIAIAVAVSLGTATCSDHPDHSAPPPPGSWVVVHNNVQGAPLFVRPSGDPGVALTPGTTPEAAARAFLLAQRALLGMSDPANELTLSRTGGGPKFKGTQFATFDQVEHGTPVSGARVTVLFDATGRIRGVASSYVPAVASVDTTPSVAPSAAIAAAQADLALRDPATANVSPAVAPAPRLALLPVAGTPILSPAPALLAYRLYLSYGPPIGPRSMEYWIDAKSGAVVQASNALDRQVTGGTQVSAAGIGARKDPKQFWATTDAHGISWMQEIDPATQLAEWTQAAGIPNVEISAPAPTGPWEAAAVDAYVYVGEAAHWWSLWGQFSYDGAGATRITSIVDSPVIPDKASFDRGAQIIWVGDPMNNPFEWSVALDAMAHEYTHGVVLHDLQLTPNVQVGAVNESLADVFGQFIENDEPSAYTPSFALLGEGMGDAFPLRDLQDPHQSGEHREADNIYDPTEPFFVDVATDVQWGTGVPNNAWFLSTFGGTNGTSNVTVDSGHALDFPEAETEYALLVQSGMPITSLFDLSQGLLIATMGLFPTLPGPDPQPEPETDAVACAWYAVGVLAPLDLLPLGVKDCECNGKDGAYCAGDGVFGTPDTLYQCDAGLLTSEQFCLNGCMANGGGGDVCAPGSSSSGMANNNQGAAGGCFGRAPGTYCGSDGATLFSCNALGGQTGSQTCASGCQATGGAQDACNGCGGQTGTFCGGNGVPGDPGTLYRCSAGSLSTVGVCPTGCAPGAAGADACSSNPAPCTGQPAGSVCSPDGSKLNACDGNGNSMGAPTNCGACIANGNGTDVCLPPPGDNGGDAGSGGGDGGSGGGDGGSGPGMTVPNGDRGSSLGDPHATTFDGLLYDFQAVGEFVLVSDGQGYVVQVRQQPYRQSKSIATNVAVAAQVGSDRVAFYATQPPSLRVNGRLATVATSAKLPGGGVVARAASGQTVVTWPSGDALAVSPAGDHLNVYPVLHPQAGRTIVGLLGNDDGVMANDIAFRDSGAPLAAPIRFHDLYPAYADSWRITQPESLFDYASGETTETFTDRSFPAERVAAGTLPPSAYDSARAACVSAGETNPLLVPACTLDVAVGQSAALAAEYAGAPLPKAALSTAYYSADFESPIGSEWSKASVATSVGSASYGATSYLGPLGDETVTLTLAGLPAHDTVSLTFDLYVVGPWTGGTSAPGETIQVNAQTLTLLDASFANGSGVQSYPGVFGTGASNAAATGATAVDALGLSSDAGATLSDAIYHQRFTFADVSTGTLSVAFVGAGLPAGSGASWGIDNLEIDLATGGTTTAGGVTFVHGTPGPPAVVGCADGTREAFLDQATYPKIAGCMATWTGAADMRAAPSGTACGDGIGACGVPADACASTWHVCGTSGAVSELRAISPLECENSGNGMFISAMSHCASQDTTCTYDFDGGANYACYPSGWCSEAVCCGDSCTRLGACPGGVWTGLTHITPSESNGCGATVAPSAGGVLCCSP